MNYSSSIPVRKSVPYVFALVAILVAGGCKPWETEVLPAPGLPEGACAYREAGGNSRDWAEARLQRVKSIIESETIGGASVQVYADGSHVYLSSQERKGSKTRHPIYSIQVHFECGGAAINYFRSQIYSSRQSSLAERLRDEDSKSYREFLSNQPTFKVLHSNLWHSSEEYNCKTCTNDYGIQYSCDCEIDYQYQFSYIWMDTSRATKAGTVINGRQAVDFEASVSSEDPVLEFRRIRAQLPSESPLAEGLRVFETLLTKIPAVRSQDEEN
jgi:hypothetical protein